MWRICWTGCSRRSASGNEPVYCSGVPVSACAMIECPGGMLTRELMFHVKHYYGLHVSPAYLRPAFDEHSGNPYIQGRSFT
jgi:hypothetical protein